MVNLTFLKHQMVTGKDHSLGPIIRTKFERETTCSFAQVNPSNLKGKLLQVSRNCGKYSTTNIGLIAIHLFILLLLCYQKFGLPLHTLN